MLLVDAGPLIALIDKGQEAHRRWSKTYLFFPDSFFCLYPDLLLINSKLPCVSSFCACGRSWCYLTRVTFRLNKRAYSTNMCFDQIAGCSNTVF